MNNNINRRHFFKLVGGGTLATSSLLTACRKRSTISSEGHYGEPPKDKMTYRPSSSAPVFPSIRVFSNESALRIRWPKYWSFSFSISPSNEY